MRNVQAIESKKDFRKDVVNAEEKVADILMADILTELSSNNKMSFKEIQHFLSDSNSVTSDELEILLTRLLTAKYIGKVPSAYRDFNIYYITAEGLKVARRLSGVETLRAIAA